MLKKFSYLASVSVLASLVIAQTAHAMEPEEEGNTGKCQLQQKKSKFIDQKEIQKKYEELFLDDWQKLVLQRRNEEAKELAFQRENQSNNPGHNYAINNPFWDEEYCELRNRKGLQPDEVFRDGFFRIYQTRPQQLIEKYEKRISALELAVATRLKLMMELENAPREWLSVEDVAKHFPAFMKDTQEKIAKEKNRIEFIKENPTFFQISSRSRAQLLGLEMHEQSSGKSPIYLGKGVVVGIIDGFDTCQQTSKILNRAINTDFQGKARFGGLDEDGKNHGIHVAGIIVCDVADQNDSPMTLGVAPDAQFEMMNNQSLKSKSRRLEGAASQEWTVEKMADAITSLSHEGTIRLKSSGTVHILDLSMDSLLNNPIVNSKAKILNLSMSMTPLTANGRQGQGMFEAVENLLVLVKSMQTKLLVIAAGNDGIALSSIPQYRLPKALAHSPATANSMLLVTNLMQDGLTLYPSSNIPGKDPLVQARTLSAPGTQIKSTLLITTPESAPYGEMTGTSMATPHVSGLAAVLSSNFPHFTNHMLSECLLKGATPLLHDENASCSYELKNFTASCLNSLLEEHPEGIEISKDQFISTNSIDSLAHLKVTKEWWQKSQELFGQGRVNLKNALNFAKEM